MQTGPCTLCGTTTEMTGTRLCDRCWELKHRIEADLDLAQKILNAKRKPVVLVTVNGGIADIKAFPCKEYVEVLHIDFDNLKQGDTSTERIQAYIASVENLLPDGNEHKQHILTDLNSVLEDRLYIDPDA